MSQETKLGIFVLLGILGMALAIVLLGDFQFERRYYLNILFKDIAGLPAKAKVKIAGVDIGAVKNITLKGDMANVKVWIKHDVTIYRDTRASIVATGLIGSKYLELTAGSPEAAVLKDGDVLQGVTPIAFDKLAADVMIQINKLVEGFKGGKGESIGENLGMTLDNLRRVSESLKVALAYQQDKLVNIVSNINSFTGDLAQISSENKENLKAAITGMKTVTERLDRVLALIEGGEGTIGKLMTDKEMGNDVKAAVQDLRETSNEAKRTLKRINSIGTEWDYTLRYDGRDEIFRNDVGLRINPNKDKYYFVGVSNAGELPDGVTDPEKTNTINLLIGKKYYGTINAYAGVIRSKGGLGAKVRPLSKWNPWSRLEITAEGYDFFRIKPVKKPFVNIGGKVELTKWASVGAQVEDTYDQSKLNSYLNIVFDDQDVGYVLGLVGLAGR